MLITRGLGTDGTGTSVPTYIGVEDPTMGSTFEGSISTHGVENRPAVDSAFESSRPHIRSFEKPLSLTSDFRDLRPSMSGKEE